MSNKNLETRTLLDEIPNFDKGSVFFDLDHPLLNRIAHSFIKAAGIGAIQAVSREAYFTALEGETNRISLEALKNSAVAGAITGVALALTSDNSSLEQIVQSAITGAAISTAANVLADPF